MNAVVIGVVATAVLITSGCLCSEDCPEKFEEDPETYLEKMQ